MDFGEREFVAMEFDVSSDIRISNMNNRAFWLQRKEYLDLKEKNAQGC